MAVKLNAVYASRFCNWQVLCHAIVNLLPGGESAHIQEQHKVRTDLLQSKSLSPLFYTVSFFPLFVELTVTCLFFSIKAFLLWIVKLDFSMLCLCPVQVLASVLICLLDWLMVIPVSKLLSKTNEDENVSILARMFQVIIYPFRDWENSLPLTHSGVVRDWAEISHWCPCTISLVVSYSRKLKAICSQWGAV